MSTNPPPTDDREVQTPIYTIGYGSRSMEAFLAVLATHHIAYLIDIRSKPYSRYKPEFSREELERRVRAAGLKYLYMGDALGGQPADRTCYVDGRVVYDRIKVTAPYQAGLRRLEAAARQDLRVALMCSEGKPETCHRSKLVGQSLVEMNITVLHIDENDQPRTQVEVILDLTNGQLGLFGEPTFTSRKRYREREDDGHDEED